MTRRFVVVFFVGMSLVPAGYARAEKPVWQAELREKLVEGVTLIDDNNRSGTMFTVKTERVKAGTGSIQSMYAYPKSYYYEGSVKREDQEAKNRGFMGNIGKAAMSRPALAASYFKIGEPVNIWKLDVKDDGVHVTVIAAELREMGRSRKEVRLGGEIVFQFADGFLEKATADQVWTEMAKALEPQGGIKRTPAPASQVAQAEPSAPVSNPLIGKSSMEVISRFGPPSTIKDQADRSQVLVYDNLGIQVVVKDGKIIDMKQK